MLLNEDQLASRAGASVELIREMRHLEILPAGDSFDESTVPRVRLAVQLERTGVPISALAQMIAGGGLSLETLDRSLSGPTRIGLLEQTRTEYAKQLGMSEDFADRVQIALGVSEGDTSVSEDDAEMMKALTGMVALGVDEDVIATLFEIITDNVRRVTRAMSEMWHAGVRDPILASGASHRELLGQQWVDGDQFILLGESLINTLWSRFLDDEIFRGTVETLAVALDEIGIAGTADEQSPAIAFLDLTAFTHLTDDSGDVVAAAGARDLAAVVRRTSVPWGGTLVKMLGDGAMLHFKDPSSAVSCCLALVHDIPDAGLPRARFGVDSGSVVARDVDFFGHTVNVAARLVDYARPGEVLVTSSVVQAVQSNDVKFNTIGPVSLKGVASLVTVHSALGKHT